MICKNIIECFVIRLQHKIGWSCSGLYSKHPTSQCIVVPDCVSFVIFDVPFLVIIQACKAKLKILIPDLYMAISIKVHSAIPRSRQLRHPSLAAE